MTSSGSDAHALALVDQERLGAYLSDVVVLDGPPVVEVLSGGRSNITYLVRSGAHEYVVRRRPLGTVAAGAHDMAREHRVLAALQGRGLPIPKVHGYCQDEGLVGAPFYVMDRVRGRVLHRRSDAEDLAPASAAALSRSTVEVLDRLHRIDVEAAGLAGLGRPEGFVARRIGRWLDQWRHSAHRDHPLVESLGARLAVAVPESTDATLVHGDYRLGNLLVDADPGSGGVPAVAAILDWEMSTLGDPLTDLAHLMVYWDRTRGRLTHESQTIAEHPGFLPSTTLAEAYAASSGRDISGLDFYLAFEHWRAAIIKEGIYTRSLEVAGAGAETDSDTAQLGRSVAVHLEEARDILEG
ncbi:phosphotransferase family protein [Acidiferrimicrobium sp. IK]|uniref:phosphotransferase family protein n=1 Tax=Acidiferrimicrobium sp. IK TaxID=2871700 RepID=UPI0021CB6D0F|nr:phosphotransferase family protein [Acidiferrimicrobium sp. IK]MCU4186364.1 phosphotransferase family protein [Acidiferrimicrobium sp. IK]